MAERIVGLVMVKVAEKKEDRLVKAIRAKQESIKEYVLQEPATCNRCYREALQWVLDQIEAIDGNTPKCPQCKSSEHVKEVKGCRCMSCPPWVCGACKPHEGAGHKGYDFFDDDESSKGE